MIKECNIILFARFRLKKCSNFLELSYLSFERQTMPVSKDMQNVVLVAGVSWSVDSSLRDLTPLEDA